MRILASIIPLLVLGGVRAGEGPAYPDTCSYTRGVMCGDQFIRDADDYCYCGSYTDTDAFQPYYTDEHCCLEPGKTCTRGQFSGHCNEGRKLSKSSACNTTMGPRCYNSYQHSQYISHKAQYTCPNTCVPWQEMCRGLSWCEGDHQVCGPDLRCPRYGKSGTNTVPKVSLSSSSLVPGHHYCIENINTKTNVF